MSLESMIITATFFNKTKRVLAYCHNMTPDEQFDRVLWVERSEDSYALLSPQLRDKKVAIVHRSDWLSGTEVTES